MEVQRWRRRWRKKLYGKKNAAEANKTIYRHLETMLTEYTRPKDYSFRQLTIIYLLSSFLYYELDYSILADEKYDRLCRYLLDHYKEWKRDDTIMHRKLIKKSDLRAGSAFQIRVMDYPGLITRAARYITKKAGHD